MSAESLCHYLRAKVSGAAHGDKRALFALRNETDSCTRTAAARTGRAASRSRPAKMSADSR